MAGKGGGAWKVAYADFVTAMMAFFMVMWLVAQSKPMKEAIASYFNDPSGKNPRQGNGKSNGMLNKDTPPPPAPRGPLKGTGHRQAVAKTTSDDGKGRGASRQVVAMNLRNNNDLVVEAIVTFDEGSADLDARARQSLDRLAEDLIGKWSKIEIRGHTSPRPLPPDSKYHDDWQLSFARSVVVMKYLTDKGIEPKRFRLSECGANEPVSQGTNYGLGAPEGRVEVFVLGEVVGSSRPSGKKKATPADNPPAGVQENPNFDGHPVELTVYSVCKHSACRDGFDDLLDSSEFEADRANWVLNRDDPPLAGQRLRSNRPRRFAQRQPPQDDPVRSVVGEIPVSPAVNPESLSRAERNQTQMNRAFFAMLTAVALLSSTGCEVGDQLFGCTRSDCNSCPTCNNGSCNSGSCNCGTCGNGDCGNSACGNSACGNGACGHGDGSMAMAGDPSANGCGPNGCGPNGGGYGDGHGPLPRGVGGQYVGPQGPPTGGVAYPYYTNRGPRDFLDPNPPDIGN